MNNVKLYRFSPILDTKTFQTALEYVTTESGKLAQKLVDRELPIDTITLFAHYPQEYDFLAQTVRGYGKKSQLSHGSTLYIDCDFKVLDQHIKVLGVRQPEPYRMQVGYGDYPVDDYDTLLAAHAASPYVREIQTGRSRSLIELWHPDYDVLGYVAPKKDHLI